MLKFLHGSRRAASSGSAFSLVELMVVILLMTLLLGVAAWAVIGNRSVQTAKSSVTQIVSDLRLCATKAETEKTTYGIRFRFSNCATDPNTYSFVGVQGGGAWGTLTPPTGASGTNTTIHLPETGGIVGVTPSGIAYSGGSMVEIVFTPVGEMTFTAYGNGSGSNTTFTSGSISSASITVDDKNDTSKQATCIIYPFGDIQSPGM